MPNVIYDLAVRLSFTAPALAGPIAQAIGSFGGLERAAAKAQKALDDLGKQQAMMPQVIYKHQAAVDALTASQINLARAQERLSNTPAPLVGFPKATEDVQLAQSRLNQASARLNMTPVPSVVAAGLAADQAAAQQASTDANAALGAGVKAQNRLMAGGVLVAGGLIGADLVKHWVDDAMQMQQAMEKVSLATGASADQMARMQTIAQDVSARVQMSSTDVMNIALLASTSGFNNPRQLMQSLPTLANVAEIAQQMRGVDPSASVPEYVRMAHMFQQYGANLKDSPATARMKNASFNQMLSLAARSLLVSGSTPAELSRVMQYLAPTRAAFNLPPEDIIQFASLAMNVGLTGGRGGGARLGRFAQQLVPLVGNKKHNEALAYLEGKAGANFTDANGNLSTQYNQNPLVNALEIIERFNNAVKNPAKRLAVMGAVFGSSGSIAAEALSNPGAIGRALQIMMELGGGKGALAPVTTMQQGLAGTVQGQMKVFRTDITNIAQNLGNQLLPALNKTLELLVKIAGAVQTFTRQHSAITEFVAVFVALGSAAAIVGGSILVLVGAWALLAPAVGLSMAALLPFLGWGALAVAAIALIITAITHWSDITKFLGDVWKGFSMVFGPVAGLLKDFVVSGLEAMFGPLITVIGLFLKWSDAGTVLGNLFKWMGSRLHDFLVMLGILHNGSASDTLGHTGTQAVPPGYALAPGAKAPSNDQLGHWVYGRGYARFIPDPPPKHAIVMPRGKRGIGGGYGHAGTIVHFEPHYHINGPDAKTSNDLATKIHKKSMDGLEEHLAQAVRNDTSLNEGLVMAYH